MEGTAHAAGGASHVAREAPTLLWISTVAGNGTPGYSGDGGPAEGALLNWPRDVALDGDGTLHIADTNNHRIRRVGTDGTLATIAGVGSEGHSGDGGPALLAELAAPRGVAVAADGSLYIADTGNHCIRKITAEGRIITIAGTGECGYSGEDGAAADAQLSWPSAIAIGSDGGVYVADTGNHCIRRVAPDGRVSTFAGTAVSGFDGDGRPAVCARLSAPRGLAVGRDGSVYIGDTENHRVRKVTPDGTISTAAGDGRAGYMGDGTPAAGARLCFPRGVALGKDGSLFIADCGNSVIRQVGPDGRIATVAGTGIEGYARDGGPAICARLADPHGVAVTRGGVIYVAEPRSSCVRRIWPVR